MVKYKLVTDHLMLLLGSIAFGFLGGSLFVCCMSLGIAMIGALGGAILGHIILNAASVTIPVARIVTTLVLALAGAILVNFFERPTIIACTSIPGAFIIIFAVDLVVNVGIAYDSINGSQPVKESYIEYGAMAGVAVLGMLYQWLRHKRAKFRPQKEVPRYAVAEQKFQPPPAYAPAPVVIITPGANASYGPSPGPGAGYGPGSGSNAGYGSSPGANAGYGSSPGSNAGGGFAGGTNTSGGFAGGANTSGGFAGGANTSGGFAGGAAGGGFAGGAAGGGGGYGSNTPQPPASSNLSSTAANVGYGANVSQSPGVRQ